jgi:DNA repair exonuclease SbcCD ATPase subunit
LKNKLINSQNDYKCLLEKFETFANLNCELTTKIEQLESNAPSLATDDGLIKNNENLKAKLASSQEAIENLLEKMEILSIHNNELTTKLENIGSTLGASLVENQKIIKKDTSTYLSGTIIRGTLKTPNSQLVTPISVKLQRPDGYD